MKKVLLIHNIFWSHYKATVFSELARIFKGKYEFLVLQIALTEKTRKKLGNVDYSIHQYPYKILFEKTYQETSLLQRCKKLAQELKNYDPDVVILPGYNDPSYIFTMILVKLKGIRLMSTADSTLYDRPRKWYKEKFKQLVLKLPDKFFCYGIRSREYLQILGVPDNKIHLRVQATDNNLIRQKYLDAKKSNSTIVKVVSNYNFIFVGRLIKSKKVDTLLEAYAHCLRTESKTQNWSILILGDGEEKENLEKLSEMLGIQDKISFIGSVNWDEVPNYYALADVFIFPSESETWGLVINEAMLCELPILVSDKCGAAPDLIENGKNGYTFDPNDSDLLPQLMLKFIIEEVDKEKFGKQSLELIKNYTPQRAANQMLDGINELF